MCIRLVRHFESCRRQDGSKVQHTRQHIIRCSLPYGFHGTGSFSYHPCLNTLDTLEEWYQQECPECSGDSEHPRVNRFKKVWNFAPKGDSDAVELYALSLLKLLSVAVDSDPAMGALLTDMNGMQLIAYLNRIVDFAIPEMVCREVPQHGFFNPHLEHSGTDAPCACVTELHSSHTNPAVFLRRIMIYNMVQVLSSAIDGDADVNNQYMPMIAGNADRRLASCKQMQPIRIMHNGDLVVPINHIQPYTRDSLEFRVTTLNRDGLQFTRDVSIKVGVRGWYTDQRFQHYKKVLDVGKAILAADRGLSLNFARSVFAKVLWILPPSNRQNPSQTFDAMPGLEAMAVGWARTIHRKIRLWESSASRQNKEVGLFRKFLGGDTPNRVMWLGIEREKWIKHNLRESGRIITAYKYMDSLTPEVKEKFRGETCVVCGNNFLAPPMDEEANPSDNHGWDDPVVHRACARKPDGTPFHVIGKRCFIRIARDVDQRLIPQCPFCRQNYRTPSPPHVTAPGQDEGDYLDG